MTNGNKWYYTITTIIVIRSDLDIDLLVNGGNKRLWDLLMAYNMPRDAAFEFKYLTKLGYYYRYMVKAISSAEN